ncbi:MAG: RcnB family protein [Telluria sp.]
MTKKFMIVAAVAATFVSGAAFAQTYDNRNYRNDNRGETRYEQQDRAHRGDRNDYSQRGQNYDRRDHYDRNDRQGRYDNSYRGYERRDYRHNGAHYGVRRGEYLAHHYRGSRYVVSDWRGRRHLYAPPRGHQWVQAGNDYLLVALATGVIAQVLLNN